MASEILQALLRLLQMGCIPSIVVLTPTALNVSKHAFDDSSQIRSRMSSRQSSRLSFLQGPEKMSKFLISTTPIAFIVPTRLSLKRRSVSISRTELLTLNISSKAQDSKRSYKAFRSLPIGLRQIFSRYSAAGLDSSLTMLRLASSIRMAFCTFPSRAGGKHFIVAGLRWAMSAQFPLDLFADPAFVSSLFSF